jgi:hypothetical protein
MKSMNSLCDPGFFDEKIITIPSEKYKTLIITSTGVFLGSQSKKSPNNRGAVKETTKIFRKPKKRRLYLRNFNLSKKYTQIF